MSEKATWVTDPEYLRWLASIANIDGKKTVATMLYQMANDLEVEDRAKRAEGEKGVCC